MEKKYFPLGTAESSRIIKVIRIFFGLVCIAVAVFWVHFNLTALKTDVTLWITILFLLGFGLFQIWSGLGKATRFIEFDNNSIRLKKNAIMPPVEMVSSDIERIEIFPLNVIIYFKSQKKTLLRFGTTYHEQNEKILDELIAFAETNNIQFEVIEEKL